MTPYEEMVAAMKAAEQRSQKRKASAETLVAELFSGFAKYAEMPPQSLALLTWNRAIGAYDSYDASKMVGIPHSLRLDEERDAWQFGLFMRLNPANSSPALGVSLQIRFRESGDGYKVEIYEAGRHMVRLSQPDTFIAVFAAWVDTAKATYNSIAPIPTPEPKDDGMAPQVWS